MPKIFVVAEAIQSTATEINNCAIKQDQVLSMVDKTIADLNNGWEGSAQKSFADFYEKAKPTYARFHEDMKRFSSFLTEYLSSIQMLDRWGARRFSRTPGPGPEEMG